MRTYRLILMALAIALLVVASVAIAKEGESSSERQRSAQTATIVTAAKPDTDQDNSLIPALPPTLTPATPEAGEQITWWVIGAGGGTGSGGGFTLSGTIGQTAVDLGSSDNYWLRSGYWQVFGSAGCCVDRVGDANGLGGDEPTISDASVMIDAKFITGTCDGIIACITEADINQSGLLTADCDDITISDISILIDYLFITGPTLGLANCL